VYPWRLLRKKEIVKKGVVWLDRKGGPPIHVFRTSLSKKTFWKATAKFILILALILGIVTILIWIVVSIILLLYGLIGLTGIIAILVLLLIFYATIVFSLAVPIIMTSYIHSILIDIVRVEAYGNRIEVINRNSLIRRFWVFYYKDMIRIERFEAKKFPYRENLVGLNLFWVYRYLKTTKLPQGIFFNPFAHGKEMYIITLNRIVKETDVSGNSKKKFGEIVLDIDDIDKFKEIVKMGGGF
jgi:hypothetical protein